MSLAARNVWSSSRGATLSIATGLYADFHCLRHTFITNMVKSGVNPKTAQSLARHSTIDLTMNVYTSLTVHDQASALASLPAVPVPNTPVSGA